MRATLPLAVLLGLLPTLAHAQRPEATAPYSPGFLQWVRTGQPIVGPERGAEGAQQATTDDERVGVVIHTGNADALVRAGLRIESRYPTFVTARMTRAEAARWVEHPAVSHVEAGIEETIDNDEAAALVGVRGLREGLLGGTSYTGAGTIVCVIDSGIDYTHLTFRSVSDPTKSRILRIWDQTITAAFAETPPTIASSGINFTYGVEYTKTHLDNELDGTPAGFVRQTDSNGHGTHVAGTAAGNGSTHTPALHAGMAPAADIVFVKGGNTGFPTANIIDGLSYCNALGTTLGKPVVVNMSLGSDFGPHDGTDSKNLAVTSFSTSTSGRAAVQSAGNSGGTLLHRAGTVAAGDSVSLTFTIPAYNAAAGTGNDNTYFDVWFNTGSTIRAKLISPGGTVTQQAPGGEITNPQADGSGYIFNRLDPNNLDRRLIVGVTDAVAGIPAQGVWTMRFINDGASADGFHAYHYDRTIGNPVVAVTFTGADATNTVSNAATGGFAVGSWTHRHNWQASDNGVYGSGTNRTDLRSSFSSQGPSRDGRTMPSISAPGQWIMSARSASAAPGASSLLPDTRWMINNGTSMASPVVAGAVALLFQQNPALTFAQVQSLVTTNARVDAAVGVAPNNEFGAGKLDIYQAMARLVDGASTTSIGVRQYDESATASTGATLAANTVNDLRFQSPVATSGVLRGVMFHTSAAQPSGGYDIRVYADNAGAQGAQLGTTVNLPLTHAKGGSWNYVDLTSQNILLLPGTEYHYSVTPRGSSGSFRHDGATTTSRSTTATSDAGPFTASTHDALMRVFVSSGAVALPVELVAFEAVQAGRTARLAWTTAAETDNAGFAVEHRLLTGAEGSGAWRQIAYVAGAGTTSEAHSYGLTTAALAPGRHAFRLRQLDLDGTATLSPSVEITLGADRVLALHRLGANPFGATTTLGLTVPASGRAIVRLFDVLGREVSVLFSGDVEAGALVRVPVDGSVLAPGVYVARAEQGGRAETLTLTHSR